MKQLLCQVTAMESLSPTVFRVVLSLPETIAFHGGQYVQVVMGERDKRAFSIASCPSQTKEVELHIGATEDNPYAMQVIEQAKAEGQLEVELPLGTAFYRVQSQRPMVLIAGGTGFSYTWSILQAHLKSGSTRPVTLYWGGRQAQDLYFHDKLVALSDSYPHFHYRPVIENADADWKGAVGLVHHAVLAEQSDLSEADVYVAGRFEMVRVIRDDFHARGLPLEQLYGDALAFI